MRQVSIEVTGIVRLYYDPESEAFKKSLEAYKKTIDKRADVEDMLKHVAFHLTRFGVDSMVEGVGYIGHNGLHPGFKEGLYSGIDVRDGYDDFEFEITRTSSVETD